VNLRTVSPKFLKQLDDSCYLLLVIARRGALELRAMAVDDFDSMLVYSASYTLEKDKVIHHVDASWNPLGASAI
jgi:hypothetical protein